MKTFSKKSLFVLMLSALSAVAQRQEVWITPVGTANTDPYPTAGTASTPWVTPDEASFDYLIDRSGQITNHSTIHLMAGTFYTTNLIPQPGWKIFGAGISNTVVQMVPLSASSASPVIGYYSNPFPATTNLNGVEVSDLTVDCNLQNQTQSTIAVPAISLNGSNVKIKNVRAINWGSKTGSIECFIFTIWNPNQQPYTNCVIDGCIVGRPAQTTHGCGADGFNIFGGTATMDTTGETAATGEIFDARIMNCLIENVNANPSGVNAPTYFHGSVMSVYGGKIDHNLMRNLNGSCIYASCTAFVNLTIENNEFLNNSGGITICDSSCDTCGENSSFTRQNLIVRNNLITVQENTSALLIKGYGLPLTNVLVQNNFIRAVAPVTNCWGAIFGTSTNVTFTDNVIDLGSENSLYELYADSSVGFARMENNTECNGSPITVDGNVWSQKSASALWNPIPFSKNKPFTITYSGIDAAVTGNYFLMQIPPNVTFIVTGMTVETTAITGSITTPATVDLSSVGGNVYIGPASLSSGATAGSYQVLSPNLNAPVQTGGGNVQFSITSGAAVSSQTITVDVSGYFR